jgi:hypothetical protein
MSNQTIKIVNVETGVETEREMNANELAEYQARQEAAAAEEAAAQAKETARQALLDKLGISADEAKLLLG